MHFLKVPRKQAETKRRELVVQGLISIDYPIIQEGAFVLLPILKKDNRLSNFEIVEREVEKRPKTFNKLSDALSGLLTQEEFDLLTTSFDIIGDIAIVEIPPKLENKEEQIGNALLKVHKNLKTVLKKRGPMEGEFRVRKLKHIAGENKTETLYGENRVKMKLDVAKVYFSVRLAHERKRIADLVKNGEQILVLFAGVGPFALTIAKSKPSCQIVGVELNPDAVDYFNQNIKLNKFTKVKVIECDVSDFEKYSKPDFDRVIVALPKTGHQFLEIAFKMVKSGGIVHFYNVVPLSNPFDSALERAQEKAKVSRVLLSLSDQRIVRPYSPKEVQVVLDLVVTKRV